MVNIKGQINTFLYAWYDFRSKGIKDVLIIRNNDDSIEEDALSDVRDIVCATDTSEVSGADFDAVISLVSPEIKDSPEAYIKSCYDLLKPGGVLLFPMNNRLGIRYFCGDRDPYTERNFDGIMAYDQTGEMPSGRCYSKSEIKDFMLKAGTGSYKIYGVFSGIDYPTHLIAEGYHPNEDLRNRILPVYHYSPTVFLKEENIYDTLNDESILHALANAFLVEVTKDGVLSDALYITLSLGRARENAYSTIIREGDRVTKKAFYEDGVKGLLTTITNHEELEKRGIEVVKVQRESAEADCKSVSMPYITAATAQKYLQELLLVDKERFLTEMDVFMSEVDKASDIIKIDPELGPVADVAYPDMVTVNAFRTDSGYVFFDQEFTLTDYPINAVKTRILSTFFAYHDELRFVEDELYQRYGLSEQKETYMEMEASFLHGIWSEGELKPFRDSIRRNSSVTGVNRSNINFFEQTWDTKFLDIFRGADQKDCYVFGAGKYAQDFIDKYGQIVTIKNIVDNDSDRWGQVFNGIEIISPEELRSRNLAKLRVFVCASHYDEIVAQLEDMRIPDYSIYRKYAFYPISKICPERSRKKYHVGYCAGAFDMFHVGHLNLLRRAKEMCDILVVGVISDQRIYDLKNRYPIIPCDERIKVVEGCRYVDKAVVIPADRAAIMDAYNMIHFDCMFSGDDHIDDPLWIEEQENLRKLGSDLVFVSYTKETSSTMLREKIKEQK